MGLGGHVEEDVADRRGPLGVGLVGCGRIAQLFHLPVLTALPGARLVAVADADAARLAGGKDVASDAFAAADYREVLARPDVEAVVICLPTELHAEAAIAAFEHGKHVYVEKPLAPTASEAADVLEAWRRAGTVGAMGYVFRFHPLYQELRRAIESGAVGEVVAVRTSFGSVARELPAWKRARATGGGALVDLASHHIDLVRFLFGREVIEAGAVLRSVHTADDNALLELVLEGGLLVQTLASTTAVQEDRVEVYGVEGKLVVDRHRSRTLEFVRSVLEPSRRRRVLGVLRRIPRGAAVIRHALVPPSEPSFALALRAFVDAVRGGGLDGATLEDGYKALLVVEAAEEASRTGRRASVASITSTVEYGPG